MGKLLQNIGLHAIYDCSCPTISQIYSWLEDTARSCPSSLHCEVLSIGESYEGRNLPVIKVKMKLSILPAKVLRHVLKENQNGNNKSAKYSSKTDLKTQEEVARNSKPGIRGPTKIKQCPPKKT